MKKIMMFCYGGGHVKIVSSIYQAIKSDYNVKILAFNSAIDTLRGMGIPFFTLLSYAEIFDEDVFLYGGMLADDLERIAIGYDETVMYLGCSFYDLANKVGYDTAINLYEDKGFSAFLPIRTMYKILINERPDLVVSTTAPRAELAALIAAKELSIPSVAIKDNVWVSDTLRQIVRDNLASTLCVFSEEFKNIIQPLNAKQHIVPTGTPVYDHLKYLKRNSVDKSCVTVLLADVECPLIHPMYPGGRGVLDFDKMVRRELDNLALLPGWNVIFRPHPSQIADYLEFNNVSISDPSESLHLLLESVDVVVTAISTVGLEGLVAGTGLVSLESTVFNSKHSYYKLGYSTPVYRASELKEAIINELTMKKDGKIKLYDGEASCNIKECIDNLLVSCYRSSD